VNLQFGHLFDGGQCRDFRDSDDRQARRLGTAYGLCNSGILESTHSHFYVFEFRTLQLAPDARFKRRMFSSAT